eukprot:SM000028S10185  [mRNA]  locus=s28:852186:854962:- [translate_table: standard]
MILCAAVVGQANNPLYLESFSGRSGGGGGGGGGRARASRSAAAAWLARRAAAAGERLAGPPKRAARRAGAAASGPAIGSPCFSDHPRLPAPEITLRNAGSPHVWKVHAAREDERIVQVFAVPMRNFGLLLSLGIGQLSENHEEVAEQPQTLSLDKDTEEQSTDFREADAGGHSCAEHERVVESTAIADKSAEGVSEAADVEGYAGQDSSEGVEESQTLVADQGTGKNCRAADVGGHAGVADQKESWQDEIGFTAKDCDMHVLPLLAQADSLSRLADMVDITLKDLREAIIRLQDNSRRDSSVNMPVPAPIGEVLGEEMVQGREIGGKHQDDTLELLLSLYAEDMRVSLEHLTSAAEALQRSNERVLSSRSGLTPGNVTQGGQEAPPSDAGLMASLRQKLDNWKSLQQELLASVGSLWALAGQRATSMQQSVNNLADQDMRVAENAPEGLDRPSVDQASVQQAGLERAKGATAGTDGHTFRLDEVIRSKTASQLSRKREQTGAAVRRLRQQAATSLQVADATMTRILVNPDQSIARFEQNMTAAGEGLDRWLQHMMDAICKS